MADNQVDIIIYPGFTTIVYKKYLICIGYVVCILCKIRKNNETREFISTIIFEFIVIWLLNKHCVLRKNCDAVYIKYVINFFDII